MCQTFPQIDGKISWFKSICYAESSMNKLHDYIKENLGNVYWL